MFYASLKTKTAARTSVIGSRVYRPAVPVIAAAAIALLAGCAAQHRDSVTVGSIPDDYRTNHPILIAEKEQKIDLPVGASERGMTKLQRIALEGFLSDYDRSAAPVVSILVPSGAVNDEAASYASRDFVHFARKNGVPESRIVVSSYQAPVADVSAPIRVAYTAIKAQTDKCGRWPEDIAETSENKHYANFGCSYQNNMAAQIANPADLLGPRKSGEIDAERRGIVIEDYRESVPNEFGEVDYGN